MDDLKTIMNEEERQKRGRLPAPKFIGRIISRFRK
jgi:hypothetical protein